MKYRKIGGNANHHLFWRGPKIWVRFFKEGKGELARSLKTTEVSLARIRRDQEIANFLGEQPKWKGPTFLVEDKFPEFVDLKRTKSPRTFRSISDHWRLHLKPYFGGMRLQDVSETEWTKYVQEKRKTHPGRKFFNDRKYLGMFLNWAHRNGLVKVIPRLQDVDPKKRAGKVFTDEDVARLDHASRGELQLQIRMAITMGMRKGEILSLEWWQIDFKKETIYLPPEKTKIRKERTFSISTVCLDGLRALYGDHESEWVFPAHRGATGGQTSNHKAWVACKKAAGVIGRWHDLRHTFLTRAFKTSVNPALICHYAGLSLAEAQRTYLHFNSDDTRVVSGLVNIGGITWQNLDRDQKI